MFFEGQIKPAIRPRKGGAVFTLCGICDEEDWAVAVDTATGWDICQECIHDALTTECNLVNLASMLRLRHPRPKEFRGKRPPT